MVKLFKISPKKPSFINSCFASQCTPAINTSQLLSLEFKTNKGLERIPFTDNHINLTKNLNVDKVDERDNISIRMIKLCGKSIALPLRLIF